MTRSVALTLGLLLAACSEPSVDPRPVVPITFAAPAKQGGEITLDYVNYARDLLPLYHRAIEACQGALSADTIAPFRWSGWVSPEGRLTASAARVDDPGQSDRLARCVAEKLRRAALPTPSGLAPYVSGYPVAFSWAP